MDIKKGTSIIKKGTSIIKKGWPSLLPLPAYLILFILVPVYKFVLPWAVFIGYFAIFITFYKKDPNENTKLYIRDYKAGTPEGITLLIYGLLAGGALTEAFITYHEEIDSSKTLEHLQITKYTDYIAIILNDPNDLFRLLTFLLIAVPFYHGAVLGLTASTQKIDPKNRLKIDLRMPVLFIHAGLLLLMSKGIANSIIFTEWLCYSCSSI
jgi:hypothetical protein